MTYVVVISGVRTRETARDYGQKTHFIYGIIIRVIKKKKKGRKNDLRGRKKKC